MSDIDEFEDGDGGDGQSPEPVIPGEDASEGAVAMGGHPDFCLSCGAPQVGVFCVRCGQKQDDLRRSLFLLGRDFIEDTFSFDGRMWRTLGLLVAAPGAVPMQFSHGKRSQFTPPVRLFLVVSFLFFLTIGLTNTLFVGVKVEFKAPDPAKIEQATAKARAAGVELEEPDNPECRFQGKLRFFVKERHLDNDLERIDACINNTRELAKTQIDGAEKINIGEQGTLEEEKQEAEEIVDRVFKGIEWTVENPRAFNDAINDWLPRVMLAMTPVLALILTLFLRRGALIFDHMVLSLYLHSVGFAIVGASLILTQIGLSAIAGFAALAIIIYYVAALKRAYERGWVKTIWTASVSGFFYMLILFSVLLAIISRVVWVVSV